MKTFAAARVQRLSSLATIRAAEAHGRRLDEAAAIRVDPDRTRMNLAASQYSPDDPLALEMAFREFKKRTGAQEQKRAAVMAHVIAVISPDVLEEVGDPQDPKNPRVIKLFEEAQAWAKAEFGEESLVAARLDVDEAGSGVVDLYVCPTARMRGGNGRKEKTAISVNKGLENIAKREQERNGWDKPPKNFRALQDSWGRHAAAHIDPRLTRGVPKRESQRKHIHADIYREAIKAVRDVPDIHPPKVTPPRLLENKSEWENSNNNMIASSFNDMRDLVHEYKVQADAREALFDEMREKAEEEARIILKKARSAEYLAQRNSDIAVQNRISTQERMVSLQGRELAAGRWEKELEAEKNRLFEWESQFQQRAAEQDKKIRALEKERDKTIKALEGDKTALAAQVMALEAEVETLKAPTPAPAFIQLADLPAELLDWAMSSQQNKTKWTDYRINEKKNTWTLLTETGAEKSGSGSVSFLSALVGNARLAIRFLLEFFEPERVCSHLVRTQNMPEPPPPEPVGRPLISRGPGM